ncbi:MAG: alcohol dehydrogenase catalytic domain-containing protein [bacterium]|nr:alcohol dehydrogenase catalytic domain-containing protein [bacterium]
MKAAIWIGDNDPKLSKKRGRPATKLNGDGPFLSGITDIEDPKPGKGEVVIEVRACGICGSDIYKALNSLKDPGAVLGHEVTGIIAEVGEGVYRFKPGDRVLAWHHAPCGSCHYCKRGSFSMCRQFIATNFYPGGFAEKILLPPELVSTALFKLPPDTSYEIASLVEPLGCIYRAIERTKLRKDDVALIIGAGFIGQLALSALKDRVGNIVVTDIQPDRRDMAERRGATAAVSPKKVKDTVINVSRGRGADYIMMTFTSQKTIAEAQDIVRDGGTICQFAGPLTKSEPKWSSDLIYHKDLTVYGSYSPSPASFNTAFRKITWGDIELSDIELNTYPLDKTGVAFGDQAEHRVMKAIVTPTYDEE